MSPEFGRLLIVVGLVIVGVGVLAVLGVRLGRLPGDIVVGGERGALFIPIVTSIILSIVLTVLLNLVFRR
jgi:uncharacterized membrane protein YidH (DUF202 family)